MTNTNLRDYIEKYESQIFDDFWDYEWDISFKLIGEYYIVDFHVKARKAWDGRHGQLHIKESDVVSFLRDRNIDTVLAK